MRKTMFLIFLIIGTTLVMAEPITGGWWDQTASTAGQGMNVAMEIMSLTPHMISLESNNGWMGFAYYDSEMMHYVGFFELLKYQMDEGMDDWANEVFQFTLEYDGLTLTLHAQSPERAFQATFWKR